MYKKGLFSLLMALSMTQSVLATDWSIVRSGGISYVSESAVMGLYFYAKSDETLSLNHFGGPTTLFCAYSSIDNLDHFLGNKVIEPGESMILHPRHTNLYVTYCTQISGISGDNSLGILTASSLRKKTELDSEQNNFELSETERDILLDELREYANQNTQ